MNLLSRILFPAAVLAYAVGGVSGALRPDPGYSGVTVLSPVSDTVVYQSDGYRARRTGDFEPYTIPDSILSSLGVFSIEVKQELTALDTLVPPDSLKYSDPFRYKYYAALIDSYAHSFVHDTLSESFTARSESNDSLILKLASADSLDLALLDSTFFADSLIAAEIALQERLAAMSPKERKAWEREQRELAKLARADSLAAAKEEKKAYKDSILQATPRILETYTLQDSMTRHRIITWTVDQDFHQMDVKDVDTTYNYHYYDYPFQKQDVNSTWLGVAGSPVQPSDFFKREGREGVEFYKAMESWNYSPSTVPHYNSKTPHTELAYYGTILAKDEKESDNIHIFTTQNVTPELNLSFLYDRFGGGGMLDNEETKNKTTVINSNYLGKRYSMHAGFIRNNVSHEENGGMADNTWIRDTTLDAREIPINLGSGLSILKKNTVYLDQQLRIPFNFIYRLREKNNPGYHHDPDSLDRDITTAFIGHSSEFSNYSRVYTDHMSSLKERAFFNEVMNFGTTSSNDSLRVMRLENKVYIKLQPWSADAAVSNLNLGLGDTFELYHDSTAVNTSHRENSIYGYAGAGGRVRRYFEWDAKARYYIAGYKAGDFNVDATARFNFYPFRRARNLPVSFGARFETSLKEPNHYQQFFRSNHYIWENAFAKTSMTSLNAFIDVPYWDFSASATYGLVKNYVYYDETAMPAQNGELMNVLSVKLQKDFHIGTFLHLENQLLYQHSSMPDIVPVPDLAVNLRWYFQFVLQRNENKDKILEMQVGANAFYNTAWHSPGWNPVMGVFHNQTANLYNNGPYFDAFVNFQWKRACIFIKVENAGQGWPMEKADYFSADNYIVTQRSIKLGIFWPFYIQPTR